MTMRLLIDESVLVEYVGERQPYCACWDKINALQLVGYAELWATSASYGAMERALCEVLPADEVHGALLSTLKFVQVCSVDAEDVRFALECGEGYHAGILASCARKVKADYVVTRRRDATFADKALVFTPEGLFDYLEKEKGVTFDLVDF